MKKKIDRLAFNVTERLFYYSPSRSKRFYGQPIGYYPNLKARLGAEFVPRSMMHPWLVHKKGSKQRMKTNIKKVEKGREGLK